MASTYTTGFGIEKIGTGEQAGAWGTTTNHNADILDRIASYTAVALSGATHTLTVREASPGSGTENLQDGMYRVIKFTGALGANNTVTIAPNTSPVWFIIENATTDSGSSGPYSVILTQGSGANVTVQNGKNAIIYCDGAGAGAAVYDALADLQVGTLEVTGAIAAASLTLTTDLAIADGGTGASTASAARAALDVDPAGTDNSTNVTLAGTPDYITISGQTITRGAVVLTTDISGTLPIANGGTNATSAGAALTALGAAASGANSDITSLTGLTTDLTVAQGGTGAGTFAANGILYGNGTGAIGATAVGTATHVLTSNGAGVAPTFQAAAGGATDIDGLSDALTNSSGATIGLGTGALVNDDGSANNNTAVGFEALNDITDGDYCTAVGYLAGAKTTYAYNTFIGSEAGKNATGYYFNTAVGAAAMGVAAHLNGGYNTVFGAAAMSGASTTYASKNVCVGVYSGSALTTGGFNTFMGYDGGLDNLCTTGMNNIVIGNAASTSVATVSNEITLGDAAITTLRCQVTSITALSDRRDKKDIVPLELGLDFINSLNPVKFTWNTRDGAKVGQQEAGFIAQELDEAQIAAGAETYLDIVLKENLDKLEAAPGKLIPVLVKAIQDLSAEVATLKEQINGK